MRHLGLIAAAAILGMTGCQTEPGPTETDQVEATDATAATLSGEACPDVGEKAYFFWMEPRSAEPGDQIALFPYWTDMPGGYNDLPAGCIGGLDVFPEDAATFARQDDGLVIATISPDVASGTTIILSGTYAGARALSGPVKVYRAEENPLVGTWRQASDDCPTESAVRELVFSGGGEFSVTWTPFEVYKDYWGTYEYNREDGAISLTVEGGNQVPEDIVAEGAAILTDDALRFEGLFFGTPRQAEGGCRAEFPRG